MLYTPRVRAAMIYAFEAHEGQVDRSGVPYIHHPLHVAEQMGTEDEIVVALLHDVMEDTDSTASDLRAIGISETSMEALLLLTHDPSIPYLDYVRALKGNPLARKVKLADLQHNSDLSRLPSISAKDQARVEKYREARAILEDPTIAP